MLTRKMRDQIENCKPIARSNSGCFSPCPQVQISAELPMSYPLYTIDRSTYMCPSVRVRVSVPDVTEGWGFYSIVFDQAIPRHTLDDGRVIVLSQAAFDTQVQAVVAEATGIASRYTGWEAS